MDYITFFFAIAHSEADYLRETMKSYDIGHYLMTMETKDGSHAATKGQHFHFVVQMSPEIYHKFSKRVITKYKLVGQARNGVGRQYGKTLDPIRNLEKLKQYVVKEGNLTNIHTDLCKEEIAILIEKSYKKEEAKSTETELLIYLGKVPLSKWISVQEHYLHESLDILYHNCAVNYDSLTMAVIQFHLEKDKRVPPPSSIKCIVKTFISQIDIPILLRCKLLQVLMDIRNPFSQRL